MGVPGLIQTAGGINAAGSITQGFAASQAANYNEKIAQQNAQIATQNAGWAGAEGEQQVGMAGLKAQQEEGNVKVAQAANNVDVNTGSAKDVQSSVAKMAMLNEMNIRSTAAQKAYGFENQAVSAEEQSKLYGMERKSDETGGILKGVGSMLGAEASASEYSNWLGGKGITGGGNGDFGNAPEAE